MFVIHDPWWLFLELTILVYFCSNMTIGNAMHNT